MISDVTEMAGGLHDPAGDVRWPVDPHPAAGPPASGVIDGLAGTEGETAADALTRHQQQLARMSGAIDRLAGHDVHPLRPSEVAARLARLTEQYHQLPLDARPLAYLMSLERVYQTIGGTFATIPVGGDGKHQAAPQRARPVVGPGPHPSSFAAAWRRVVRVFSSERAI